MAHKQPFGIIDALLIVGIIFLTGFLFWTIWNPGQEMAKADNYKWEARARMSMLRIAENQYFATKATYTSNMDSLLEFCSDSIPATRQDSIFTKLYLTQFHFDSLRKSPRNQLPFTLAVVDTMELPRYQITDPDGFGYVSSLTDPDEHNKGSWEQ